MEHELDRAVDQSNDIPATIPKHITVSEWELLQSLDFTKLQTLRQCQLELKQMLDATVYYQGRIYTIWSAYRLAQRFDDGTDQVVFDLCPYGHKVEHIMTDEQKQELEILRRRFPDRTNLEPQGWGYGRDGELLPDEQCFKYPDGMIPEVPYDAVYLVHEA